MKKYKTPEEFDLDARDLAVMKLNGIQKLSIQQTATKLGISPSTVKRIRQKKSYADLAQAALSDNGYSIGRYVEDLIEATKAEKVVIQNGVTLKVADHAARNQAMKLIGSIYGTDAPKELEKRAGISQMSDDEIMQSLAKVIYDYENTDRPGISTESSRSGTSVSPNAEDATTA